MALLQQIPSSDQFMTILAAITGTDEEGTGIAGALKYLSNIDTAGISSSFVSQLDGTLSSAISIDTTAFTGDVVDKFKQAANSLPADPEKMVAPLRDKLDSVKGLSSTELSGKLLETIGGFQEIESLIPVDTRTLISGAADGLTQLKSQFISGPWGELRQWSSSVQGLYDEIEPLFASGSGSVEDRLVAFLADKISDIVKIILPQQKDLFEKISSGIDEAISSSKVKALLKAKSDLVEQFRKVRQEFESGNFTNTAHLATAEASFQQITGELEQIISKLKPILDSEIASAEGMISALQKQYDDFESVEIVDLGNIKDKFKDAIISAEDGLKDVNLEVVRETIEGVFDNIRDVIDRFDLSKLSQNLHDLQGKIQTVLDGIDAALFDVVAAVRNIFMQIKEALKSVAGTLGTYDEEDKFTFHVQEDIEGFLNSVKSNLQNTVQPMMVGFKTTVSGNLQQIQDILTSVQSKIESVKTELLTTLGGIRDTLKELDVTGKLEEIRDKLENMLDGLGEIDFDPVVDPVIAQINEMRDELKEIDLSSLNDFLKEGLKLAAKVVQDLNFTEDITEALLNEIDDMLELPKEGLRETEDRIESVLEKLTELDPEVILKPLDDLFDPVTKQLDELKLEKLLEPLDAWHESMQQEVDKVSPAALLQPITDLYEQLQTSFASISPEAIVRPLQEAIDDFKSELQGLDVTGIADELCSALDDAKNIIDGISPESLFTPLVNAFDKIITALDRFNPGDLLKSFTDIFDKLMGPLENLTQDHVNLIGEAFSSLKGLSISFDPQHIFQTVSQKYIEVQNLLQQINVGKILLELKSPYDSLNTAFEDGRDQEYTDVKRRIDDLNSMQNAIITQAASEFQQFQNQLQNALSQTNPPTDLLSHYKEIKPKVESLIPTWIKDDMTPESVKAAFKLANPLNITEEVNQLYDAFKEQVQIFNPRTLQEEVKEMFEELKETFLTLDPDVIVNGIQGVIDNLNKKLDTIDLQMIVEELQGLSDQTEEIIQGLDPQPIIRQLETLTEEVKTMADELKPSEVLDELDAPFQSAKDIVEAFDPVVFIESLQSIFEEIKDVISKIDIGIILEPLSRRLEDLRDELEEGLKRTETAFSGMLTVIPV